MAVGCVGSLGIRCDHGCETWVKVKYGLNEGVDWVLTVCDQPAEVIERGVARM